MIKKTLTVGIPIFNEESNIRKLVRSVLDQKNQGFELTSVIVSSDGSTDSSIDKLRKIKDVRLTVFDNKDRRGISRGLNQIISQTNTDILVTLDGDVKITTRNFLTKLIKPILEEKADLTSSSIKEASPETYIAKVLNISMKLKSILFEVYKNGNNIYNCHGLARAYSKRFYSNLNFPVSIGNDMYCYLNAISRGYHFEYTPNAQALYKLPENWQDHKKQSERFFVTEQEMENIFGRRIVEKEIKIPFFIYFKASLKALKLLLENPFESIIYLFMQLYLRVKPKDKNAREQTWDIAISSKKI